MNRFGVKSIDEFIHNRLIGPEDFITPAREKAVVFSNSFHLLEELVK
jgi:hypothetical protein